MQLANRCLREELAALTALLERSDLSASERVERCVLETLRNTHERWSKQPRINELVEVIARERMDVIQEHLEAKHRMVILYHFIQFS